MNFTPAPPPHTGANLYKHGLYKHPLYKRWSGMIQRCHNPNTPSYKYYGAKGIKVCTQWLKFENFLKDMGLPKEGQTLERIDNSKGYEPLNCKWEYPSQQMKNRSNSVVVTFKGRSMILSDWAKELGLQRRTLKYRIENWPIEKAFTSQQFKRNGKPK